MDVAKITKEMQSPAMKELGKAFGSIYNRVQQGSLTREKATVMNASAKCLLQASIFDWAMNGQIKRIPNG